MSLLAPAMPPDALQQVEALVGMKVRLEQWNYEATRDTIRHYAWGIGDDNPLYSDPDYAEKSRWGTIIAPPTFLYGIHDAVIAPGLPDIQWFYAGADWFFDRPVRRNEEITATGAYMGAQQVGGGRVKSMLMQTGEVIYSAGNGERVGRTLSHCFRVPRQQAEGGLKYEARPAHQYSRAELEAIEKAVLTEERRGSQPRYFEDVKEGDPLPGTVRGPLTQIDMTAYYAGAVGTSGYKSTKLRWTYGHWGRNDPDRLPNNYDPSYFGAATLPSIGHQDQKVAVSELGMPGPYDNGPQRLGFVATSVTTWMGADGEMREYSLRLKLPVIFGDTTYTKGRVPAKRREGGRGLVEVEVWAENQLGQQTAVGRALVELPLREG
jgi:acyl dehydratase